jgi:hypothetical protein
VFPFHSRVSQRGVAAPIQIIMKWQVWYFAEVPKRTGRAE